MVVIGGGHCEGVLGRAGQTFDLVFTLAGGATVDGWFGIMQLNRTARARVFGTSPIIMGVNASLQIIGNAGIEGAVTAPQNIHCPTHLVLHPIMAIAYL